VIVTGIVLVCPMATEPKLTEFDATTNPEIPSPDNAMENGSPFQVTLLVAFAGPNAVGAKSKNI
jgi:hypothetical protein